MAISDAANETDVWPSHFHLPVPQGTGGQVERPGLVLMVGSDAGVSDPEGNGSCLDPHGQRIDFIEPSCECIDALLCSNCPGIRICAVHFAVYCRCFATADMGAIQRCIDMLIAHKSVGRVRVAVCTGHVAMRYRMHIAFSQPCVIFASGGSVCVVMCVLAPIPVRLLAVGLECPSDRLLTCQSLTSFRYNRTTKG